MKKKSYRVVALYCNFLRNILGTLTGHVKSIPSIFYNIPHLSGIIHVLSFCPITVLPPLYGPGRPMRVS